MITEFKPSRVSGQPVSDEELINDLIKAAQESGEKSITMLKYREIGQYDDTTISRRFGSWNKALEKVGLKISNTVNINDEVLFENILTQANCRRTLTVY